MTHTYTITGMTCNGCVAKVKSELLKLGEVTAAEVQLAGPQATITMQKHVPLNVLQNALYKAGRYTISEDAGNVNEQAQQPAKSWVATYKPVLLIFFYITLVSFITSFSQGVIDWMKWMNVFMGGFFLTFSFFKLLDLKGFAESYAMYDVIAKHFPLWGFVYAFAELALGIAFATGYYPLLTNLVTLVVMAVGLAGVLQTIVNKQKIRCACLGSVFNLPMSTVTVVENGAMIIMSAIMLINLV